MDRINNILKGDSAAGKTITSTLPKPDVDKLDALCRQLSVRRSEFIKAAVMDSADKIATERGGWDAVVAADMPEPGDDE